MYEKPGGASIHSGLRPFYYVVKMVLSILLVLTAERDGHGGGIMTLTARLFVVD